MTTQDGTLLSSMIERRTDFGFTTNLSGDRFFEPIVDGVVEAYRDRFSPAVEPLIYGPGTKVTLLRAGVGAMGHHYVDVMPGTLFAGSRGLGILPKGKRTQGYVVQNVLDVLPGYTGEQVFRERIAELRAEWPEVRHADLEDIKALPGGQRKDIHGVFFGKWFGGAAIWFATNKLSGDGDNFIVEGCIAIDPRFGDSEYGSVYGDELLRCAGVTEDFPPLTFREALDLDWPTALQLCAQRTDKAGLVSHG